MTETNPPQRNKVQLQLAIFEATRAAPGKTMAEIHEILRAAFTRRGLPSPPGPWLDAVASEAFYGKPYILDLPTAVTADGAVAAPDPQVQQTLAGRRLLRQAEALPAADEHPARAGADTGNSPGIRRTPCAVPAPGARLAAIGRIVTGALVLSLAAWAIIAVRMARQPLPKPDPGHRDRIAVPGRATVLRRWPD